MINVIFIILGWLLQSVVIGLVLTLIRMAFLYYKEMDSEIKTKDGLTFFLVTEAIVIPAIFAVRIAIIGLNEIITFLGI